MPKTGTYNFYLRSDDGSKLYLDGELVIDNNGSNSANTKESMKVLKKGVNPIRIDYFEDFLLDEYSKKLITSKIDWDKIVSLKFSIERNIFLVSQFIKM